jgi:acyl-CoA synthetase (AMP-forming)/AMP-acid ligase II/acyl carrier protein
LLVYPPSLDFTIAFLACLKAGVVAVPVFPPNPVRRDTLHMFAKITESSQPKYALTNSEYSHMKKLAGAKDAITRFKRPLGGTWPDSLDWIVTDDNGSKKSLDNFTLPPPKASDVAFLQFTSGSTSDPKGVMITHGNLAHNLTIITSELKAKEDTVVVSWLPQYHDMGLIGSYLGVLYCGGSGYYMSPLSFLQRPMLWMEATSKYKATHLQAPNFAFKLTARKFQASNYVNKPLQLAAVRHVINAAEPCDEDAIQTFYRAFGPFGLREVIFPTYGLAEHTVFVCSGGKQRIWVWKEKMEVEGIVSVVTTDTPNVHSASSLSRMVGCGFPVRQGVDVRIVDHESRKEMDAERVGEIWINSPSKAAGYFGKKAESMDDFEAKIESDEGGKSSAVINGYLRTGDLGFFYNDELFICGRLKDLIILAGRNYYPQDIEATAEACSDLLRPGCSAAFSVTKSHEGGEEVALVLELRDVPGSSIEVQRLCDPLADQIRSAVNQEHSLAVSHIVLVSTKTVPKTSSGKIARAWCRKGFLADTLQSVFKKSFQKGAETFEIEADENSTAAAAAKSSNAPLTEDKIAELRAMSKDEIMDRLRVDVASTAQVPPDSIDNDTALVTILDSLSIAQFKGRLESAYAVRISDEYLFRETLTLKKLADVVKLGYAPDDTGGEMANGGQSQATPSSIPTGSAGGLAGCLGCPPGVRCVIQ